MKTNPIRSAFSAFAWSILTAACIGAATNGAETVAAGPDRGALSARRRATTDAEAARPWETPTIVINQRAAATTLLRTDSPGAQEASEVLARQTNQIMNNHVLNVNLGNATKTGFAAIDQSANNYWNPYNMPAQTPGVPRNRRGRDTDTDGLPDGSERRGFNNLDRTAGGDLDGDGLPNLEEYQFRTKPTSADSDGDHLLGGDEVYAHKTSPQIADSDGDGRTDWQEIYHGSDPLNPADDATRANVTDQRGAAKSKKVAPGPHLVVWFSNGTWYLSVAGGDPGVFYSVSGRQHCCSGAWTWVTQIMVGGQYMLINPSYTSYYYRLDIGSEDNDDDGLANIVEASFGTNPNVFDNLNGNGVADWREDTDEDGLPNAYEILIGSNPSDPGTAPVLPMFEKCPLP
jgi:hypothetical protein